jgi:hypothetical protein
VSRRGVVRVIFTIAFAVLLLDGAAAVWLGQLWGRRAVVVAGVLLLGAAIGVALWHRRWMRDLDAIELAKRELRHSIEALRSVVADAQGRRQG